MLVLLVCVCLVLCNSGVWSQAPWSNLPCPRYAYPGAPGVFDVRDYGGVGDGKTLNTEAFKKAIEAAHKHDGGGCVGVFDGKYLSGRIGLLSHTYLFVDKTAMVLGSTNCKDYPNPSTLPADNAWAVVAALNATNVGILGLGVIDGQAYKFIDYYNPVSNKLIPKEWKKAECYGKTGRPRLIQFVSSKLITILDIHFNNSLFWTSHWLGCSRLWFDNVYIYGDERWPNNDGLDPDSSEDLYIVNSQIHTGDDALCPKSTNGYGPLRNLVAENLVLSSRSSAIKFGSSTWDHMYNCTFNNIRIQQSHRGIGIQARDRGNVNHLVFTNMVIDFTQFYPHTWWGAGEPIWVTDVHRTPSEPLGIVSDIHFENITAYSENGVVVTGVRGHRISGISFKNVNVNIRKLGNYTQDTIDYRPTSVQPDMVNQPVHGWWVNVGDVTIDDCGVSFASPREKHWGKCIDYKDSTVKNSNFTCTNG